MTISSFQAKFITLEGIEGTGKTTALRFIANWFKQRHIPFLQTREPGGTDIAEQIRDIFLKKQDETLCVDAELLLVFAARAQHLNHVIWPAIKEGKIVLCDRFTDATYAYQGGGRQMDCARISMIETWVQGAFRPDKIILLDAPVELCLQRTMRRGKLDRIEQEQAAFFERARAIYLDRAADAPNRYILVDVARPLAQVQEQLIKILTSLQTS